MPIKHEPNASLIELKKVYLEQCSDLWDKHQERFMTYMDESETKKVGLTFSATLDFTESNASLETSIRYSQVVKDKRVAEITDPNQSEMFPRSEGAENGEEASTEETTKRNKGRQRKKDMDDAPEE